PCPTSGFLARIFTLLSGVNLMNAKGASGAGAFPLPCPRATSGLKYNPNITPPPARPVTLRKERRSIFLVFMGILYLMLAVWVLCLLPLDISCDATRIAWRMRRYVPQRQRLPFIAVSISLSLGLGVFARSAAAAIIWPA